MNFFTWVSIKKGLIKTYFVVATDDLAVCSAHDSCAPSVTGFGGADAVLFDFNVGEVLGDPSGGDLHVLSLLVWL